MVLYEEVQRIVSSNKEVFRLPPITIPGEAPCEWIRLPPVSSLIDLDEDMDQPSPPIVKQSPVLPKKTVTAVVAKPTPVLPTIAKSSADTPKKPSRIYDPVVLGIEFADPMYPDAPHHTRRRIECEEAQRIEGMLNNLYKSQGGRSRGWTKGGLELMIKPRCASGGNLHELDAAKKTFPWPLVTSDKPTSAFLDFICVAKRIRIAVWFEEKKQVFLYPAADHSEAEAPIPLLHVSDHGSLLSSRDRFTCPEFLHYCDTNRWVLLPPASILHSLEGLTLAELESVGKKLGMTEVSGTKATRVATVAIYKLRQRLQS
jgi:hypothetical protein